MVWGLFVNNYLKAPTHSAGGRAAGQVTGQAAVHPAASKDKKEPGFMPLGINPAALPPACV
jgi:hypothetical protein